MNLEFAMDERAVRDSIIRGNIALSPIRGMGKTEILLDVIQDKHYGTSRVVILAPSRQQCVLLSSMWLERHRGGPTATKLYFYSTARDLDEKLRGLPSSVPVYFDEYMNFEESERAKFYRMHHINFCGGTATFRG